MNYAIMQGKCEGSGSNFEALVECEQRYGIAKRCNFKSLYIITLCY